MKSKKVFRIEKPTEQAGMWYDKNGIIRNKIHIMCPDGIAKDLPMPFNADLHRKDGLIWFSSGKSIKNMNEWFSKSDAENLINNGFKLFEFEVSIFQELKMEILFCREGVIKQKEIQLKSIWNND